MLTDLLHQFEQRELHFLLAGAQLESDLYEHPDEEKWNNKDCPRCKTAFSCVMKGSDQDYRYRCVRCGALID